MDVAETQMDSEIQAVFQQTTRLPLFGWRLEITAGDKTVNPDRILSLDIVRDYDINFADKLVCKILIGAGTYTSDIVPYRNNLTGMLYQEPLNTQGESIEGADTWSQEVMITLVDNTDPNKALTTNVLQNKESADRTSFVEVELQLSDIVLEVARMISVGGVYRDTSVQDLVKYLMTYYLKELRVDESMAVTGVKMYPASNQAPIANIVLPHGMEFVQIPDFLHERVAGIYSTGLGHYLQDNLWHIYPLYDTTRYENDLRGLTIINLPANRYTKIERTYRTTANQVIVLASGEGATFDDSESRQLNQGNGVRFTNADAAMGGLATTEGNKSTALRAENNSEFVTTQRDSGRNNVRVSSTPITNNTFLEASKLARSQGSYAARVWENANPRLLFPGMPVRWMYMENGEWVEQHGVLLGAHYFVQAPPKPLTSKRHMCTATLRVFLERTSDTDNQ